MLPAIVTALGTVIVALVGYVGTRLDRRDLRKRLREDAEIMDKLPEDSVARALLSAHSGWLANEIVFDDKVRVERRLLAWRLFWTVFTTVLTAGLAFLLGSAYDLGDFRGSVVVIFVLSAIAFIGVIANQVAGLISDARAGWKRRRNGNDRPAEPDPESPA